MILILVGLTVGRLIQQALCLASLLLFFQFKCVCLVDLLLVLVNLKMAGTIVLTFQEENQPTTSKKNISRNAFIGFCLQTTCSSVAL